MLGAEFVVATGHFGVVEGKRVEQARVFKGKDRSVSHLGKG